MFYIYMRLKHGFDFYLKLKLNICGVNHVRGKNEMFFILNKCFQLYGQHITINTYVYHVYLK